MKKVPISVIEIGSGITRAGFGGCGAKSAAEMNERLMQQCIARKRDGQELSAAEWEAIVPAFLDGTVGEAQMASLAMACVLRGMSFDEAFALTKATVDSGETISFPHAASVVDKHSSGGVSDIVSLVAVPLAAACGAHVAKLSGRALGHTGGTIDKLEAIPGFSAELSIEAFVRQVESVGCAIAAQTPALVPADKQLYALRDRTSTVPSLGLIAASIVSKKIAGGAGSIVFDVKTGAAAFMPQPSQASELARWLVEIAARFGRRAQAFVTDMNQPLGECVGTGIEVVEARDFLKGDSRKRSREVIVTIASAMIEAAGAASGDTRKRIERALSDGSAYEKFCEMISAQGGDRAAFERMRMENAQTLASPGDGYVSHIDVVRLGYAGREISSDDPAGGIRMRVSIGDRVDRGQPLIDVYGTYSGGVSALAGCIVLSQTAVQGPPAIYERSMSATR